MERKNLTKKNYGKATLIAFLSILLLSSAISVLVSADLTTATTYGDLSQYEWRETGANSDNTRSSAGPAPNTPNVLWNIGSGATPGQPSFTGVTYGWDGKIFSFSGSWIGAYEPTTGNKLWNITMPSGWSAQSGTGGTPQAFRIDNTYAGIWTSRGPVFFNYRSGTIAGLTNFNTTITGITLGGGSVFYYAGFYNAEAKVFVRYARFLDTNEHGAVAFDCSDPTQPAPVKWTFRTDTPVEVLGSAGGLVMLGGYGEGEVYAVNGTTGQQEWFQWKVGNAGYSGTTTEGVFIHGASSVFLTGYNVTNGDIEWDYNAGERAYFVYGGAAAYGRYYATNIAVDPSGYFGCWDVATGKLLWKTPALWNIAYLTPVVADGKVYCQRFQGTAAGIEAEQNTFMCMDAMTGQILWELPNVLISHPSVVYGKLYGVISSRLYCISDIAAEKGFTSWHGNPSDNGVAVGQYAPLNISVPAWTFASEGPITGSPVAANGKVYFGSFDKNFYCVDSTTGAKIWSYTVGYRIRSTPAVVGTTVYLGPDDGFVYAFNANTGALLWKTPAPGAWTTSMPGEITWTPAWQPRSSPIIDSGVLYVGSMDGKVYALDAYTGVTKWTQTIGNATFPVGGTACVANSTVYIAGGINGTTNGYLYAFNQASGSLKWSISYNSARSAVGTPIAVGDYLFIGTDSGGHSLWMLNATTGAQIARAGLSLSTGSTPAVFTPTYRASTPVELKSGTVLGGVSGGVNQTYIVNGTQTRTYDMVFAVEGMHISAWAVIYNQTNLGNSTQSSSPNRFIWNGTTVMNRIWYQWIGHQIFSSLTLAEDLTGFKLYGGSDVNSVSCLNATSGNPLSSYSTGAPVFGVIAVYDSMLFAGSHDKILYAFNTKLPTAAMFMYANINKGTQMWNNETIVIVGKIAPVVTGVFPFRDFGSFIDNGLPNAEVIVSFTGPDGKSQNVTTTTDNLGNFVLTFNPTAVGDWGWVALYTGEAKPWITYDQAYSQYGTLKVVAAPNTEPSPTTTPTPTQTPIVTVAPSPTPEATTTPAATPTQSTTFGGIAPEYIYAAIAVIAIVAIAVGAYVFTKRKK